MFNFTTFIKDYSSIFPEISKKLKKVTEISPINAFFVSNFS